MSQYIWFWLGSVLLVGGFHFMVAGADGYALWLAMLNPLVPLVSLLVAHKGKRAEDISPATFVRAFSIAWLFAALVNLIPIGSPRQLTGKLIHHEMRVTGGKSPTAANRIIVQTEEGRALQAEYPRLPGGLRVGSEVRVGVSRRLLGDQIVSIAPLPVP